MFKEACFESVGARVGHKREWVLGGRVGARERESDVRH